MKIVIEIPEEIYKHTQEYEIGGFNTENDATLFVAIKNGTPLPKGHGDLIDKKDIDANCVAYHTDYDGSWCYRISDIENNVPIIIEADKEGE